MGIGGKPADKCEIKTSLLHFAAERGKILTCKLQRCVPALGNPLSSQRSVSLNIIVGSGEGDARLLGSQLAKTELGCNSEALL